MRSRRGLAGLTLAMTLIGLSAGCAATPPQNEAPAAPTTSVEPTRPPLIELVPELPGLIGRLTQLQERSRTCLPDLAACAQLGADAELAADEIEATIDAAVPAETAVALGTSFDVLAVTGNQASRSCLDLPDDLGLPDLSFGVGCDQAVQDLDRGIDNLILELVALA